MVCTSTPITPHPQNTHFFPGGWEAADAASRVTGSCAGSSSCNNNRKQERRAEKQLCRSPSFKMLSRPSVTSEEEDEVFVFKDYTSLYRYFPSFRTLLRNTAHHLLCTFIYMPETANSCNTVDSCLWSKQKNSRFYTSAHLRALTDAVACCVVEYPFNCKALIGSGRSWQGHLFLFLTFLIQFLCGVSVCVHLEGEREKSELTQRCQSCGHCSLFHGQDRPSRPRLRV